MIVRQHHHCIGNQGVDGFKSRGSDGRGERSDSSFEPQEYGTNKEKTGILYTFNVYICIYIYIYIIITV